MSRVITLFLLISFAYNLSFAQTNEELSCGSKFDEKAHQFYLQNIQEFIKKDEAYLQNIRQKKLPNLVLPMHAYIFQRPSDGALATHPDSIVSSLAYTNELFAPMGVEIRLCQVDTIVNEAWYDFNAQAHGVENVISNDFNPMAINCYFSNELRSSSGGSVGGFANSFGEYLFMSQRSTSGTSTTMSHELAHFFGVAHTHGRYNFSPDDCNASNWDDPVITDIEYCQGCSKSNNSNLDTNSDGIPDCMQTGDDICDTNAEYVGNGMSNLYEGCNYVGNLVDACGDRYNPEVGNIMSYGPCRSFFTEGQYARMLSIIDMRFPYLECNTCEQIEGPLVVTRIESDACPGSLDWAMRIGLNSTTKDTIMFDIDSSEDIEFVLDQAIPRLYDPVFINGQSQIDKHGSRIVFNGENLPGESEYGFLILGPGAEISGIKLTNFSSNGVFIFETSDISLTNVVCDNNNNGFSISRSQNISITNCEAHQNTLEGVVLSGSTNVNINGLDLSRNQRFGLSCFSGSSNLNISKVNSVGNVTGGAFLRESEVHIDSSSFHANEGTAVSFFESNNSSISNSDISDNLDRGITVSEGTNIEIINNNIGNNSFGLMLFDNVQALYSQNSIYCNSSSIFHRSSANPSAEKPTISQLGQFSVSGTTRGGNDIEVYLNDENCTTCQAQTYMGTTTADGNGNWSYDFDRALQNGERVSAIAINGNQSSLISSCEEFSCGSLTIQLDNSIQSNYCEGSAESINLMASPAGGQFLLDGDPISNLNLADLQVDDYILTYQVMNDQGCLFEETILFEIFGTPVIAAVASSDLDCENLTTTISTEGDNNLNYEWYDPIGNLISRNASIQIEEGGTYHVKVTDNNGCTNEALVNIEDFRIDTPNSQFEVSTDGDLSITLENNSTGQIENYEWSFGDGTTSNEGTPTYKFSDYGTYEVCLVVTNACGASNPFCETVSLSCISPEIEFSSSQDFLSISFTNSSKNGTSPSWDFGDGNTSTEANPTHNYSSEGSFDVCLKDISFCGTEVEFCQMINVSSCPPPIIDFDFTSEYLVVSFSNNTMAGTGSTWDFGDDSEPVSIANPMHSYTESGSYRVCLSDISSCGTASEFCKTITIEACPAPMIAFSIEANFQSISFINMTTEGTEVLWNFGDGNTSSQENPSHLYDEAGDYTVCLSDISACGTSDEICETITVLACPAPEIEIGLTANFQEISFFNNTIGASEPVWDFGEGGTSDEANPVYLYGQPGEYEVCLTLTSSCGTRGTSCQIIMVEACPAPEIDFDYTANFQEISFQNLAANTTDPIWSFGDGNSSEESNPTHIFSSPGTYQICLTTTSSCGTSGQFCMEINVEACPAPVIEFAFESEFQEIIFVDQSVGSNSPIWDFGDGNNSTLANPEHRYEEPGTYVVCLTKTSDCGSTDEFCRSILVEACPAPMIDFSNTAFYQELSFENLTANGTNPRWDFGDGNTSTQDNPIHKYDFGGSYEVCLQDISACGTETTDCQIISVEACPAPEVEFEITVMNLDISTTNISDGLQDYLWDFGDGNQSTLFNPDHSYAAEGVYEICLTIENECGNSSQSCSMIEVKEACNLPITDFTFSVDDFEVSFSSNLDEGANYLWDFGDGTSSTTSTAILKTFDEIGNYEVSLTANNECGTNTSTQIVCIENSPRPFLVQREQDSLSFTFENIGSGNEGGSIWSFGDASEALNSSERFIEHTFPGEGTYRVCLTNVGFCGTQKSICQNIVIDFTSAVIEVNNTNFKIYPNPTSDDLYVEIADLESVSAKIYSITGQEILTVKLTKGVNKIDLSRLVSGVYMINLDNNISLFAKQ